ncbi:MAG: restriction endonuclease subunit S [Hominenteromicrobium sp.]|uniref:restriction endonuclease subunit S n=2 Tax=Hominenteromicrobium sp. TaxID=3073581 RepID=UPI002ECF84A7|nr:restriction endonuclease subunit S [Dialister invisus]
MSISAYLFKYIDINPKELLAKGALAKKISMDKLQPFCRDVPEYEIAKFSGGTRFRNGDTIMARITPCLENGKTAMVNILEPGEVGFGSTEFIVFRAKEGYTDPNFVYYLVKSSFVRDPAIKSMVGSSGRQRVQTDVVQNLIVPFPSLLEQRKIASILKSLDDKIALNTAINDNLEQQAQALFQELFITNADPNWRTGTIINLGTVIGGSTPSKAKPEYYTKNGIAWITPKDLSINKSKFITHGENDITELGLKNSSATVMPEGTVLFSSRAPIGYIAIAAGNITTNQGFKSVVPNDEIGTAYVYYYLKQNLSMIERLASGSTFKEVSGGTMKSVPAIVPDSKTIEKFNSFCLPIFEQQKVLETQNQTLAGLRDSLLPKLMSGELDASAIQL